MLLIMAESMMSGNASMLELSMSMTSMLMDLMLFIRLVGMAMMTLQSFCWIMGPILMRERLTTQPLSWRHV
jgi:hypothetical protein